MIMHEQEDRRECEEEESRQRAEEGLVALMVEGRRGQMKECGRENGT